MGQVWGCCRLFHVTHSPPPRPVHHISSVHRISCPTQPHPALHSIAPVLGRRRLPTSRASWARRARQRRQPQKSCAALDDAHIREHHQVDRRRTEGHGLDREGCPGTGSSGPASDVWHYMYIFKCVLRCGLAGILTRSQPYDINVISAS